MYVVVSYDISDNRKRNRLSKVLKAYGQRVQKSVFECRISERQLLELKAKVNRLINPDEDRVRYYDLCSRCQKTIEWTGVPPRTDEEPYAVV